MEGNGRLMERRETAEASRRREKGAGIIFN
jgi:hypothetical protein